MRYMVIVKANADSEAGVMPSNEALAAMGKYNEELVDAGVMLAGEGLHPSSNGMRVTLSDGKHVVKDGPFAETKELIAGFWILDVRSKEEVIEWVKKIPFEEGETIEIRKVFETSDFEDAGADPALMEKERELRARTEQQQKQG